MSSSGRKKRQSGSAQVGSWKFTYQDRIHSFVGVDSAAGILALSAYADLYGKLERKLYARYRAGVSLPSLKNRFLAAYRIPGRMFNSLRVSVEGKISSAREGQLRQIESLDRRIGRAKKQVSELLSVAIATRRIIRSVVSGISGTVSMLFGMT